LFLGQRKLNGYIRKTETMDPQPESIANVIKTNKAYDDWVMLTFLAAVFGE